MIEQIKALRIQAMKDRSDEGKLKRVAYEGVIASIDTLRGRGETITDELVIQNIKKEIKAYEEMSYDITAEFKAQVLNDLLPTQLTEEELKNYAFIYDGAKTPKDWLAWLDSDFVGRYDKRIAMQLFNTIIK